MRASGLIEAKSVDHPMKTVLIIGASKGIGLETVKLALKADHSVRAMARSAQAIRLHDPRLEKLDGDALDPDTIHRALAGVDAVIQMLGVSPAPEQIFYGHAPIFRSHAGSGQGDGGERGQAFDMRHRLRSGRQPRSRRNPLQRCPMPVPRACLRRQGRAGAHNPPERARLDNCSSDHSYQRTEDGETIACWSIRATGPPGLSPGPTWRIFSSSRSTTRAFCARRRHLRADPSTRDAPRAGSRGAISATDRPVSIVRTPQEMSNPMRARACLYFAVLFQLRGLLDRSNPRYQPGDEVALDQCVSGAMMMTGIDGVPSMTARMASANATSD